MIKRFYGTEFLIAVLIILLSVSFAYPYVLYKKTAQVRSAAVAGITFSMPNIVIATNEEEKQTEMTNIVRGVISTKDLIIPRIMSEISNSFQYFVPQKNLFKNSDYYKMASPNLYNKVFPYAGYTVIRRNRKNCKKLAFSLDADLVIFLDLDFFIQPVYTTIYSNTDPLNADETGIYKAARELSYVWTGMQLFIDGYDRNGKRIFYTKVMEDDDSIDSKKSYLSKDRLKELFYSMHDRFIIDFRKKFASIFKKK